MLPTPRFVTQSLPTDGQQVADHELARLRLCDDLAGLEEAVATYVGRAAEKLRGQGSLASCVMLLDLTDADRSNPALMRATDRINACWGRSTLRLAAEGVDPAWRMHRGMMPPCHTTRWAELPVVG